MWLDWRIHNWCFFSETIARSLENNSFKLVIDLKTKLYILFWVNLCHCHRFWEHKKLHELWQVVVLSFCYRNLWKVAAQSFMQLYFSIILPFLCQSVFTFFLFISRQKNLICDSVIHMLRSLFTTHARVWTEMGEWMNRKWNLVSISFNLIGFVKSMERVKSVGWD